MMASCIPGFSTTTGNKRPEATALSQFNSANGTCRGSGAGSCKAGIAVEKIAFVKAEAMRVRVLLSDLQRLEHLAGFRVQLLYRAIAGDDNPQFAVVPVEPVRAVALCRNYVHDPHVLRIHFGDNVETWRNHPQSAGL